MLTATNADAYMWRCLCIKRSFVTLKKTQDKVFNAISDGLNENE